jgi:hypothetical protein
VCYQDSLINSHLSAKDNYIDVFIMDHLKDMIPELFVDTNALYLFTSLVPSISGLSLQSRQCPVGYSTLLSFNWSHPDVFLIKYSRVSSVKTQLIYCQLKWQHVSTHRVIIRPIIEPCLRYIKWKWTFYVYGSVHHNIFYEITNRCSI